MSLLVTLRQEVEQGHRGSSGFCPSLLALFSVMKRLKAEF